MTVRTLLHLALLATALSTSNVSAAGEKGYIGLSVAVDGEGFFLNPTVKTVKVAKVMPESPAAKAGIMEGDQIVEIEGHQVAGAKANDLKPFMEREVGQSVRFAIKRADGTVQQITVVPGSRR